MNKRTIRSLAALVGALGAAAYSCSPSVEQAPGLGLTGGTAGKAAKAGASGASGTAAGGTTSGGSASGGTASGGTSSGGTGSVIIDTDAQSDGNTMLEDGGECAADTLMASLKTVNMFVMFDRSGSMNECADGTDNVAGHTCMTGDTRWQVTSEALREFFQDPTAADLRVALRFFPDDHPAVGCDGYPDTGGGRMGGIGGMTGTAGTMGAAGGLNCDTNACSQPLVDIGPLTADAAPTDVQEQKLVDAIAASAPPDASTLTVNPATPTSAALSGSVLWATTYQAAHPDEATVIILITDGEPQGCDTNAQNIARIAGDAFTNSNIQTYVIGLGGLNSATLNGIAAAGGTMTAHTVMSGASSTADLLATLNSIKGMAISCNIPVPKTDGHGNKTDPNLVNVTFQSGDTGMPTTFGRVMTAGDCGTDTAWYYDDNAAPTTITLCPSACTTATGDKMAELKVALGCATIVVTK